MPRDFLVVSSAARENGRKIRPASLLVALALLLSVPGITLAGATVPEETRDPDEHFFTQTFGDLREEAATAREDGKQGMLLFFEADTCRYCQRMRRTVLADAAVQDWFARRFVSIAVDIHGDVELTDFDGITLPSKVFSDHRKVFATPVVSFVDLSGNEVYRHVGMLKTPQEMLLLGKYIEGKHYYDTEYRVFARQQGLRDEGVLATPGEETQ